MYMFVYINFQDSTDALSVEEICKRCEFEERDELHIVVISCNIEK